MQVQVKLNFDEVGWGGLGWVGLGSFLRTFFSYRLGARLNRERFMDAYVKDFFFFDLIVFSCVIDS